MSSRLLAISWASRTLRRMTEKDGDMHCEAKSAGIRFTYLQKICCFACK